MSIIRVGLAETKKFAEGYDVIFGKKSETKEKKEETAAEESKDKKSKAAKKRK